MDRKYFLVALSFILLCKSFQGQSIDSSAVILDSKDTIILNTKKRSLINPRNLELKQKISGTFIRSQLLKNSNISHDIMRKEISRTLSRKSIIIK